jgi:hypothetical protein
MATSYVHPASASFFETDRARALPAAGRRGLLGRLWDAVVTSQRLRAEREVARYIDLNGGKLTDELEREISRRFGTHAGGGF